MLLVTSAVSAVIALMFGLVALFGPAIAAEDLRLRGPGELLGALNVFHPEAGKLSRLEADLLDRALNMAAITFMVPFGIGTAASVLVGRAVGGGRPDEARRLTSAALVVGIGFMTVTATVFLVFPGVLAQAYSPDPAVLSVAAGLVPLAGLFQVFDGTQVVAMGVLRGIGDTRIPVLVNLAGYYLVGLPISLWLGFGLRWGPRGLWCRVPKLLPAQCVELLR